MAKILDCDGCVRAKQNIRSSYHTKSTMLKPSVEGDLKSDLWNVSYGPPNFGIGRFPLFKGSYVESPSTDRFSVVDLVW